MMDYAQLIDPIDQKQVDSFETLDESGQEYETWFIECVMQD